MIHFFQFHPFLVGYLLGILSGLGAASVLIYLDMTKFEARVRRR